MSIVELPADAVLPAGTAQEERPASVAEPVSPQTAERRKANKAKRKQTETPTLLDPENLAHKKTSQDDQEQVRSQPFFLLTYVLILEHCVLGRDCQPLMSLTLGNCGSKIEKFQKTEMNHGHKYINKQNAL